jgi:hypothetical protein
MNDPSHKEQNMTTFAPVKTQTVKELDYRDSNGIAVWLLWNCEDNTLSVVVADEVAGDTFSLDVAPAQALDVFNHPFAYATSRGSCAFPAELAA